MTLANQEKKFRAVALPSVVKPMTYTLVGCITTVFVC